MEASYIICHAKCDRNNKIWDLHDNAFHRSEFKEILNELKKSDVLKSKDPKVPEVIEFLKQKGEFKYAAIRMHTLATQARNKANNYAGKVKFKDHLPAFFDVNPLIQVCVIHKKAINLRNFKVIFPSKYSESE